MPLSSYRVESEVYIQPRSGSPQPKKIAPEDIKSNQIDKPGGARPNVSADFYKPRIVNIDGIPLVESRTSNKRYLSAAIDYYKPGHRFFSQNDDYELDGMKSAGESVRPNMFNIIPEMPNFGLIVSPSSSMNLSNPRDTQPNLRVSNDIVNAVNPNNLGYFHSKLANFNSDLRNLMFDDTNRLNYEAVEWINFLEKKGFSIDTTKNPGVVGLGVEVSKEDYAASYYPSSGYLIRYERFHKLARDLISAYGLTGPEALEAMKRYILLHEFAHVLGIDGDKKSERMQGLLQIEFYTMMADRFKGTKMERIYRAIAKEGEDYAREFTPSLLERIFGESGRGGNDLGQLEHKFLLEAIALGVDDIEGYVNMRAEETVGPILRGEPSYRSHGKSKYSKSRNEGTSKIKKGLEGLIETLRKEARELGVDEGEYISNELAKSPIRYAKDGETKVEDSKSASETYEESTGKPEYKNAKNSKEKSRSDKEPCSDRKSAEKAEPQESAKE